MVDRFKRSKNFLGQRGNFRVLSRPVGKGIELTAAYEMLGPGAESAFLMETGRGPSAYSYLHFYPLETLRVKAGVTERIRENKKEKLSGKPASALKNAMLSFAQGTFRDLPPYVAGFAGYLAYHFVRYLEPIPFADSRTNPEAVFVLYRHTLVLDPSDGVAVLFTKLLPEENETKALRCDQETARLATRFKKAVAPVRSSQTRSRKEPPLSGFDSAAFAAGVKKLKAHIVEGDIFQAVLSAEQQVPLSVSDSEVYRRLREENPSPYHFLLRERTRSLVGASPEPLVRVGDQRVSTYPIAGTRPRGKTPAEDKQKERALLRSVKEKAEHIMLVDLSRNDLGRVCAPGSVQVSSFMKVQKFSHVMHLVSEVVGLLKARSTSLDALFAAFPAGTLTGAPKVRAMQLLAEIETEPRNLYGGVLVQWDFADQLDSCLIIRSALIQRGIASVRSGAGIVADSRADREENEIYNKAAVVLRALRGGRGHDVSPR